MDDKVKDKQKLQEILNEISILQKLSSELGNNTRGDKLEEYIDTLRKNIQLLNNQVEKVLDDNLKTSE